MGPPLAAGLAAPRLKRSGGRSHLPVPGQLYLATHCSTVTLQLLNVGIVVAVLFQPGSLCQKVTAAARSAVGT
jgi:hypothetical protein